MTRTIAQGGCGGAIVTSGSGDWTAAVSDVWISLSATNGAAGTPVAYVISVNTNVEDRVGYVYVAGYTHTITQTGVGGSISPTGVEVERDGGTNTIEVTAQNRMVWQARPNCDWISVTPTSGAGEGTVTYQVAPLYDVTTRSGTLTVAGKTFTVFQYGSRMKLASTSASCDYLTHAIPITVNALAITEWSVTPNASWISVVDAGNGKGGDTVTIAVAENPSYKARTGTVTIGTETFTVKQEGRTDLVFSISPTTTTASVDGANGLIAITATPDLPWTAASGANWLTIYSATQTGAGNGNVVYSASPNSTLYERSGTITVTPEAASGMKAKTQTVTQPAAISSLSLSGYEFEAAGEAVSVDVTVTDIVEWEIVNNLSWITINGDTSRVGPSTVTISASANDTVNPRSGTITIANKTFTVTQKARGVEVEYDTKLFSTDGGDGSVSIHPDGNVSWTAVASDNWIVIYQNSSGTGDAEILYVVAPYVGTGAARTGTITVGDKVIYITQRAYDLSIDPGAEWVTGNNGAGEIGVSAAIGDVWNAIVTEPWVTIVEGYDSGSGSGTVRFIYTENTTGKTRVAKIVIAGEVYTLTQAARTMVAISATAGNGGSVTGAGSYDLGSKISLTAVPSSGYAFSYWTLPDGTESMVNPLEVTVDVAKSYTATFAALKPTITSIVSDTTGVTVTWTNLAWATSYKIYRGATTVPSEATVVATLTANGTTSYQDTTGTVGQSYWYWIEAIGESDDTWSDPMAGEKKAPIVYSAITYTNLKGATHTNPGTYQEGTTVAFTNPSAVEGYTFAGWTPSAITAEMTGAQAVYANWTANTYTISYDPNGGNGTMAGTVATYDQSATLASNAFVYASHAFRGWSTNATVSAVVYADGATVKNLSSLQNGVVTLYAVWEETDPEGPTYDPPSWEPVAQEDTMIVYATVYDKVAQANLEASGSILAAFDADGICRGTTTVMTGPSGKLYQLSVGVTSSSETGLTLKLWNAATGETIEIPGTISSNTDKVLGSLIAPVVFNVGAVTQTIALKTGWNWVSTYVKLDENDVGTAFGDFSFEDNDVVKGIKSTTTFYDCSWYPDTFTIDPGKAYMVKRTAEGEETATFEGEAMSNEIAVTAGWNWFGATSDGDKTIAGLVHSDGFADGDIVKTVGSSTTYYGGSWYPNTFALTPGVGYKAKLTNAGSLSFATTSAAKTAALAQVAFAATAEKPTWEPVAQEDTLILYARVKDADGNYLETSGSVLAAFTAEGECRGTTEIMQGPTAKLYQLSIGVASDTEAGFVLKLWDADSGETYTLSSTVDSNVDKVLGSLTSPQEFSVSGGEEPTDAVPVADFGMTFNNQSMTADIGTQPSTWTIAGEPVASNYVASANGYALDLGTCDMLPQVAASKNMNDNATMIPSGKSFAVSYFGTIGTIGRSVIWNLRYYSDKQGLVFQHGANAGELQVRWMKSTSSSETGIVMTNGFPTTEFTKPHHYLVQVTTNGVVMLYVDGAKVYSAVNSTRNFTAKSYGGFALGRIYGGTDLSAYKFGNGVVDDFRVFTSADEQCLTDEQVAALSASFSRGAMVQPSIEGDAEATVTGDAESGFVVTPGSNTTEVVVTIPTGVDAAKVTVEVSPEVTAVTPNGATVKVVKTVDGTRHDITPYLNLPAAVGGVIDLTKAEVKAAVAADVMDTTRGEDPAVITLDPTRPTIQTAPTKAGLTYTLREGETLKGMADGDHTVGDGNAWTPEIKVKGGASGFYSIKVGK